MRLLALSAKQSLAVAVAGNEVGFWKPTENADSDWLEDDMTGTFTTAGFSHFQLCSIERG